ncbi:MAG TPA: polysaccharide biosynthesis tyrosine autokinase [Tepidisphaeraceae bacterium]
MTTLPQTTPVRLPRPIAPTSIAVPAPAAQSGGSQLTGADVWRIIRSNLWIIILALIVFGAGGYGLNRYLQMYYPRWTAQALLRLDTPPRMNLLRDDPGETITDQNWLQIEQMSQVQALKQESLLSDVLSTSSQNVIRTDTVWFTRFGSDMDKAKTNLRDNLVVSAIPNTRFIRAEFTAGANRDAAIILEQLLNQHLINQQRATRRRNDSRSQNLTELANQYRAHLNEIDTELRAKVMKLSIDGLGTPGRLSSKEMELGEQLKKLFELESNASSAEQMYNQVAEQVAQGDDPPGVQEQIDRDPMIMSYMQQMDGIEQEIAVQKEKWGTEVPQMKQLQIRKDLVDKKKSDRTAQVRAQATAALMAQLKRAREGTKSMLDGTKESVDILKKSLGELNNDLSIYLTRLDEQKATREVLKQIDDQLDQLRRARDRDDAAGLSWQMHPLVPEQMSFPKLPLTMAVALVLGLGLSLGIAFLREMMDTSIKSPRDISRVGQINILGVIADENDDPQSAGARLPLVISEAPHSMMAEQFRQMRTRLQHAASLDTTRSILITSPGPGDGKSTVATNLAAGLALNGRRILLVDANFRRPELHRIFNINNDQGFADLLNSQENFVQTVQETGVPNLSVLPSGPKPANATELLESQLLIDFIERALVDYDHVIFDSGPLLITSETIAMASRVDGVVTVVRARTNSRGLLQRMRDALRQVKAENLGVVLNAVRAQGGGYYGRNIKTYYEYQQA